jgi:sporulation protein YunB
MKERMWPLLDAVVRAQTENRIVSVMERMVLTEIERLNADPTDFICVNRIKDGVISEITTNTTMINRLRSSLMERVTPELAKVDRHDLAVPLGSLFESELLWGRGPSIKIRALSVGRFRVEFESGFNAEEMNRTRYKLWLILSAPTTVFLFGDRVTMEVQTRLCVAETVVIGKISSDVQKASD